MNTNELIESHMGLIKNIASKFYVPDKQDLIQVGVIGLLKAYQNFKDVALFLELDINIVSEAVVSAQAMISLDDEASELNLHEVIPDKKTNTVDLKIDLDDSFKVLNPEEQEIIRARYYDDLTQSEVARKLNMTQVMVSRYEKKSLEKLRMQML